VTKEIQVRALKECGYTSPLALAGLNNMRFDYRDDDEVRNLAVYHRTDTCFDWHRRADNRAINSKLYDLDGNITGVHEYDSNCPLSRLKPLTPFSLHYLEYARTVVRI
jgi:hypothetical protein